MSTDTIVPGPAGDLATGTWPLEPTRSSVEVSIEATTLADQRELGMTWSPLGVLRAPSTLLVPAEHRR